MPRVPICPVDRHHDHIRTSGAIRNEMDLLGRQVATYLHSFKVLIGDNGIASQWDV